MNLDHGSTSRTIGLLLALALSACKPNDLPKACPEVPVVDGFRTIVGEGGNLTLRVPAFVRVDLTADCKSARWIGADYLWHNGKLISEGINRFAVPDNERVAVNVVIDTFGAPSTMASPRQPWQFDPVLPHKRFPLEMYPRAYWKDPAMPPTTAPPDVLWGVRGTRSPITQRPFTAACNILQVDPARQESVVEGDFGKFGDAKCRGYVYAVSGTKALGGIVDVWAVGAPEIDKILNAVTAQLETFIARD